MKKTKKILALVLAFALTVAATAGATIAWLTDKESATNTFTVGNVKIALHEYGRNEEGEVVTFDQALNKILPATGSAQDDTLENGVIKEVTVKNTGTEDAYIRVHIAIPTVLDDGDPSFDASANILHFNFPKENAAAGKWDWSKTTDAPYTGDWNFYTTRIDGVDYNVYVVTYESIVPAGETIAEYAMNQVYLDSDVTNADIERIDGILVDGWNIKVVAEAVQEAGFADAYEALNEAFGKPGEYTVEWD